MSVKIEINYYREKKEWNIVAVDSTGKELLNVTTTHPGIAAMIIDRVSKDFISDTQHHSGIKQTEAGLTN